MNKLTTKIVAWHAVVAFLAWRLVLLSDRARFNEITGLEIELPSVAWFLLVTAVIGLGYMLFHRRWYSATISAVIGILFLLFLGFTWLNLLGAIIFWLCNVWAQERAMVEMQGRLKLHIQRTLSTVCMPVVLGFFIMASFAAYHSTFAEQIRDSNQLPRQTQTFIRTVVDKAFGSKLGPQDSRQRDQAINEVSTGTFTSINDFLKPYFKWAPPLVAFGLFLLLWGLSWIFVWLATIAGLIIFWILKKTQVVRIEEHDVKAEVLIV